MNTLEHVRKAPSNKTMGLELEVICTGDFYSGDYYGFYYCGHDGSLQANWNKGGRGREFVSQPLTYEWLRKETTKLYKKLGANYYVNESCGIHIHVSKKWLSDAKAMNIWRFLATLTDEDATFCLDVSPTTTVHFTPTKKHRKPVGMLLST